MGTEYEIWVKSSIGIWFQSEQAAKSKGCALLMANKLSKEMNTQVVVKQVKQIAVFQGGRNASSIR